MPNPINKNKAYRMLVDKFVDDNQSLTNPFINQNEVAKIFGKHRTTIFRWVKNKWMPPPILFGEHKKAWRRETLIRWLEKL